MTKMVLYKNRIKLDWLKMLVTSEKKNHLIELVKFLEKSEEKRMQRLKRGIESTNDFQVLD